MSRLVVHIVTAWLWRVKLSIHVCVRVPCYIQNVPCRVPYPLATRLLFQLMSSHQVPTDQLYEGDYEMSERIPNSIIVLQDSPYSECHFLEPEYFMCVNTKAHHRTSSIYLMNLLNRSLKIYFRYYCFAQLDKLEGCGFDSRCNWIYIFSIYLILPSVLGPGGYSACNRNE
jgi:hypothetical protein